jgi:chemotaxis protein MotB
VTRRNYKHGGLSAPILLFGCVWRSRYDQVVTQNQQLQQQLSGSQAHVAQLQEAIKYTVNSNLLFSSGSWQMSDSDKDIIARLAKKLAAEQQDKPVVNGYIDNAPIDPGGVTSNQILSQKRAEAAMQFIISQCVKPDMVPARGFLEADPVAIGESCDEGEVYRIAQRPLLQFR